MVVRLEASWNMADIFYFKNGQTEFPVSFSSKLVYLFYIEIQR